MRGRRASYILAVVAVIGVGGIAFGVWYSREHAAGAAPPVATPTWTPVTVQSLSHGRFANFTVYSPHDPPRGFVLLLSGGDGWTPAMADMANQLAGQGALVAGIDLAKLDANLEADGAGCVFPDGDLENLSHFVQAYFRLPDYIPPILAGNAAGATLAYAALAQAPARTFAGAVSMGFCPVLALRKPLCKSSALDFVPQPATGGVTLLPAKKLTDPWIVIQAADTGGASPAGCDAAAVRGFVAQSAGAQLIAAPAAWSGAYAKAFDALIAGNAPSPRTAAPPALADLPLISVPPQSGVTPSDTFAIMLSGDGGWAGLDKDVAAALAADGMTVIGLDSLRYFWSARSPAGLASDLERMIRYYMTELGKQRVVVIGYSQGADVLPFAVNRLSAATRAHVALLAVMGMSEHALFEFHMTSWISDDNSGPATLPEVDRVSGTPVLCIYGEEETDSLCPKLDPHKAIIVRLKGGHHFDGNYDGLARTIIASAHP